MADYKYRYNEKKYAEEILRNGFLTKFVPYEMKILVKYFKEAGYKPKERRKMLYEFCEKNIEGFTRVHYFRIINSVLEFGKKKNSKLITIGNIPITDKEVEFIDRIELTDIHKRVLFSLLVQNKINKEVCAITLKNVSQYNFFGGDGGQYKDLKEVAKIPDKYKINKIIYDFSNVGLVEVHTRGRINLLFVDEIAESDNVVINVNTFDNIGYFWDEYVGNKRIIHCEFCGKLIRASSNSRKYCRDCLSEKKREQNRERINRWREKNVTQ